MEVVHLLSGIPEFLFRLTIMIIQIDAVAGLAQVAAQRGKYREAFVIQGKAAVLTDSLYNRERMRTVNNLEILNATAQRELEIKMQAYGMERQQLSKDRYCYWGRPCPDPPRKEVLMLLDEGLTGPQIAESLFISHYTVETHRKNLKQKLNVNNLHWFKLKVCFQLVI